MKYLIIIWNFFTAHDFLVSFVSSILVTVLITFFAYFNTTIFDKPKLTLVVKQNNVYRDKILLTDDLKGNYVASFQFAIKNSGRKTFNKEEGYWHIWLRDSTGTAYDAPKEKNHKRDLINYPIYPDSFLDLNFLYNLKIKKEDLLKEEIPYFFQTDYGNFPSYAKPDSKTGQIFSNKVGLLKFEIEK